MTQSIRNWLKRTVVSAEALVVANTLSIAGDVLFAFLWNAELVLRSPSLGLTLLGFASFVGIALGLLLGSFIIRVRNQARFLAVGTGVRALAVMSVALAAWLREEWVLPLAVGAQLVDVMVGVLTAGAIFTLIAERVVKERFVSIIAFSIAASRLAVISSWLVGGMLLTYLGVVGLLLVDVLSFLPITLLLFYWARDAENLRLVQVQNRPHAETKDLASSPFMFRAFILAYALITVLGSLVSRTTPLLWQILFGEGPNAALPFEVTLGLLFAVFAAGFFLTAIAASTPWGSRWITQGLKGRRLVELVTVGMGLSLTLLPLLGFHPLSLLFGLALAGATSGLLNPIFMGKARQSFDEGLELRQAFYYMGLIGRFGEPLGSGIAGVLLAFLGIIGLYIVSGLGIVVVALMLLGVGTFLIRREIK